MTVRATSRQCFRPNPMLHEMSPTLWKGGVSLGLLIVAETVQHIERIAEPVKAFMPFIAGAVGLLTIASLALDVRRKWRDRNKEDAE